MISDKLMRIVNKACDYYERRRPKDETIDLWVEKCKSIPDIAAEYIEAHITDSEIPPKNFPSVIWALYYAWQRANPEKVAREQDFFDCPDCYEGIIYARKNGYRYIFRCIRCKQNHVQAYPKAYKSNLESQGYVIDNPKTGKLTKQEKESCIQQIERLGIKVPESLRRSIEITDGTPF